MNDIVKIVSENPVTVLTNEKTYSEFYNRIKEEVNGHSPDLSTVKGRSEIASLAYKITRSKTAIDAAGKKLNEESRAKINAVDAQRRKIRDELDALAEEVRKPLTEWEEKEKSRELKANSEISLWSELSRIDQEDTSVEVRLILAKIEQYAPDKETFQDGYDDAVSKYQAAVEKLNDGLIRLEKHEADQAELARLRAEQEERERMERERLEKEEAVRIEKERMEREAAEQKAREERAAEQAKIAAEEKARIEKENIEKEARARIEKAEAETRALKQKQEQEDAARVAEIERTKREEAARQADRNHRGEIMKQSKEAIMSQGVDEEAAKKLVLAIVAGEIPNVSLRF